MAALQALGHIGWYGIAVGAVLAVKLLMSIPVRRRRPALTEAPAGLNVAVAILREMLADHPAEGYVTTEQARQRVAAGATWMEAVRLDYNAPAADGRMLPARHGK